MAENNRRYPHPQVLLLGNGVNRAFGGGSWGQLIREITVNPDLPADCELHLPMPLRAILVTGDTVGERLLEARDALYGKLGDPGHAELLRELLGMGFDEILTTNFSYELEMAAQPDERVDDRRLAYMERHSGPGRPAETEYLLYTRNVLDWNGQERRVWHIHGEGRKPGSMILGHYFYANLLKKITNSLEGDWGRLAREQRQGRVPELRSWADAFILGDVYVLGFGFDVSEFDLWWLLNRKKKEEAETGETHFYAPADSRLGEAVNEKEALLKVLGVRVHHCGARRPRGAPLTRSGGFREFYARAIEDIRRRMAENRETGGHTGPTA